MRLDSVTLPDLMDCEVAHTHLPGQRARCPVSSSSRLGMERAVNDRIDHLLPDAWLPPRPWRVLAYPVHAMGDEPVPPYGDGILTCVHLSRYPFVLPTTGC